MSTQATNTPQMAANGERRTVQLPAGAGLALAVLLGSVMWMGIFALIM